MLTNPLQRARSHAQMTGSGSGAAEFNPQHHSIRQREKSGLGSIAFFSTSTALKFKDRPNFFPVQEVWRAAISFFDQLFLDVEPAFAFARFGQLDGSPKHLLVFFPHRASGIRFRSIIRLGLNLQSQSTCQALRSREPEMRKNGTRSCPLSTITHD